jgi:dihydrofolate reductase
MRELSLYIATSLDGYIAKAHDDLSFLSIVQKDGEDYGYNEFISGVDTVIMGRRTYDWVKEQVPDFPHSDKYTWIISRSKRADKGNITFYTGNLKMLVLKLKAEEGKQIFCDGGAEIVNELLKDDLIDEFIISIIPILVGDGIKLFKDGRPELNLELVSTKSYDTGLVQLHYKRVLIKVND